jgi:hypothetical protein
VTDPLRPFAQLIRALWHGRTQRTADNGATANHSPPTADARAPGEGVSLQTRLVSRIASIDAGNASRMRETFVETVLLWELGEHLAQDPAFGEMVERVSQQLALDPAVSAQLHELLLRLSGPARPRAHSS